MPEKITIEVEGKDATGGILQKVVTDTSKVKAGIEDINKETKKLGESSKFSLTELKSGFDIASQALEKVKQGYEFAREGAELDFQREKFDRLAATIDTTGDVLLGKMKEATKGTLSDFEAMSAATDLLSLGLAKNQDEAIRLATVQSGLAMDINQLVLTLTNQTTARFDQLGVSVDGFKERVAALEAQGYSTNDAFKEAFLQQAEAQLLKVGNAADSNLGAFKRLEAQVKNTADAFKEDLGRALGPVADALADSFEEADRYRDALEILDDKLYDQYRATGRITPEMRALVEQYLQAQSAAMEAAAGAESYDRALMVGLPAIEETTAAIEDNTKANQAYLGELDSLTKAMQDYSEDIQKVNEDERLSIEEKQAKIAEYTEEFELDARRRSLALIEEKLAADGLSEEETMRLEELGLQWGIYSEQAIEAQRAIRREAELLTETITNIPSGVSIDVAMNIVTGLGSSENIRGRAADAARYSAQSRRPYAHGGSFTIPDYYGYEGFNMGGIATASARETVTVTPAGQSSATIDDASLERLARLLENAMMRRGD